MAEKELYGPVERWFRQSGLMPTSDAIGHHILEVSTLAWARGAWMRPDLYGFAVRRRPFRSLATMDCWAIEVKDEPLTLQGVHQSLAQGRIADFVCLVGPRTSLELPVLPDVAAEAQRHGVGLAVFDRAQRWDTYALIAAPYRMNPDHQLQDEFLLAAAQVFTVEFCDLERWMRTSGEAR